MEPKQNYRGIITVAFGGQKYIEMAKWLGMSLRINAPDLATAVLTDSSDPELAEFYKHVIPYRPEMGKSVESKFYLNDFSPFDETIFVDSDCLVLNDLHELFSVFQSQPVGFIGWRYLKKGDVTSNVDVDFVLERFKLQRLGKFNSGCIYLRKCQQTTEFFDLARRLLSEAPQLRIGEFYSGGYPDEPLFALALELSGIPLVSAGTRGMWTPWGSRGPIHLDVFAGQCSFEKEGVIVTPDIIHFPGGYRETLAWHREIWKMQAHFGKPQPGYSTKCKLVVLSALRGTKRKARGAYDRWVKGKKRHLMVLDGPAKAGVSAAGNSHTS